MAAVTVEALAGAAPEGRVLGFVPGVGRWSDCWAKAAADNENSKTEKIRERENMITSNARNKSQMITRQGAVRFSP
jgi:hypothetical protein